MSYSNARIGSLLGWTRIREFPNWRGHGVAEIDGWLISSRLPLHEMILACLMANKPFWVEYQLGVPD